MHMWVHDEETMNIDEETINVGFLTARNCTSELTVKLFDRKEPITLIFPLQVDAIHLDKLFEFVHQFLTDVPCAVIVDIHNKDYHSHWMRASG